MARSLFWIDCCLTLTSLTGSAHGRHCRGDFDVSLRDIRPVESCGIGESGPDFNWD